MVRIYKENQVLSINETEVEYYKNQGYKILGEKETSEKGVSSATYNKLMEKNSELEKDLAEAKNTITTKEQEVSILQADKDNLENTNKQLEKDLAEANKKIVELEKSSKGDK